MHRSSKYVYAALVGASTGILVLLVIFALAERWFASAASPLILMLSPGLIIAGAVNAIDSELYFGAALVAQAASYALVSVAGCMAVRRYRRKGHDAA